MTLKIGTNQPAFSAGELSPSVWGRTDLSKYHLGLRASRNMISLVQGGSANRPGTEFGGRCKGQDFTNPPHLVPFTYRTVQTYALEFGALYMRVVKDGGYVLEPALPIVGVTQAVPAVFTVTAHGFATGNQVFVAGALGMTAINSTLGFQLFVQVIDANHFWATDLDGNALNTTTGAAYTGGGTVARVFTLATPYAGADVATVKYTQSADVMTLTHPAYAPMRLTRTQHWIWTLVAVTFAATVQPPTALAVTAMHNPLTDATTAGGAVQNTVNFPQMTFYYVVTSVTDAPGEESVAAAVVTCVNAALNQTNGVANQVTWAAPASGPTPARYNVYCARSQRADLDTPSIFGYIGQSISLSFTDANFAPDFSNTPPTHQNPFASEDPGCVTYYEGRQIYAGSTDHPDTVWTTKVGDFTNMDTSSPAKDDDALTLSLSSQQVNAIKHLVSLNALLALTSSGAWQITPGSTADALTPTSVFAKPQVFNGCSDLRPLTIKTDILYTDSLQSRVWDLTYNYFVAIFTGDDKTVLADHLFNGRQIVRWDYAEQPFKVVWAVRDDGVMLGWTYEKSQDVYAWHRHDTQGLFRSVVSISEGTENAVYVIVARAIPGVAAGGYVHCLERMASRNMGANLALGVTSNVEQAWFVDCGVGYGPTVQQATLVIGSGGTTGGATAVSFSVNAALFSPASIGSVIRANGGMATITAYLLPTQVQATVAPWAPFAAVPNMPAAALPAAPGQWSCTAPITVLAGLEHLNGATVSILADGSVQPAQVVADGRITLASPASIIRAGLGYTAQLQTLSLDAGEPTIQGKRKRVADVTLLLQDSRGVQVTVPKLNGDFANLPGPIEIKERTAAIDYGQPLPLRTGLERVIPMPLWGKEGSILVEQSNPLPVTVLSIVPNVVVGDDAG